MAELPEMILIIITITLMIFVLVLSIIPFLPGPVLVWGVGVVFAYLTNFERATPAAVIIMTLIMAIGSTTEIWMPFLGIRTGGMSCLSVVGSLIGGIVGTFFIPLPICGTLIGAMLGALVGEIVHVGDWRKALWASKSALELFLIGFVAEFITSIAIFITFVVSVWTTG
jgi:uncharacterized protein YqgC (DUF456 family)